MNEIHQDRAEGYESDKPRRQPERVVTPKFGDTLLRAFLENTPSNTARAYGRDLQYFKNFLLERQCEDVDSSMAGEEDSDTRGNTFRSATTEDIAAFHSHLEETDLKEASIARKLTVLGAFYKFLKANDLIADLPEMAKVSKARVKHLEAWVDFDDAQFGQVLNHLATKGFLGIRDSALYTVIAETGLTISRLVALRVADVSFDDDSNCLLSIRKNNDALVRLEGQPAKIVRKYHDERDVVLSERGLGTDEREFFLNIRLEVLSTRSVRRNFKSLIEELGFDPSLNLQNLRMLGLRRAIRNGISNTRVLARQFHIPKETIRSYVAFQKSLPANRSDTSSDSTSTTLNQQFESSWIELGNHTFPKRSDKSVPNEAVPPTRLKARPLIRRDNNSD